MTRPEPPRPERPAGRASLVEPPDFSAVWVWKGIWAVIRVMFLTATFLPMSQGSRW